MIIDSRKFLSSLKNAMSGLKAAIKEEQSFRIQIIIGVLAVFLMIYLGLSLLEKAVLILAIFLVLSLELINSQIEIILDLAEPGFHPKVQIIKDLAAAAVLISALGALITGILIFAPYFLNL